MCVFVCVSLYSTSFYAVASFIWLQKGFSVCVGGYDSYSILHWITNTPGLLGILRKIHKSVQIFYSSMRFENVTQQTTTREREEKNVFHLNNSISLLVSLSLAIFSILCHLRVNFSFVDFVVLFSIDDIFPTSTIPFRSCWNLLVAVYFSISSLHFSSPKWENFKHLNGKWDFFSELKEF